MLLLCTGRARSVSRGLLPREGPVCCCGGLGARALRTLLLPGSSAVAGVHELQAHCSQNTGDRSRSRLVMEFRCRLSSPCCYYVCCYSSGSQLLWIRDLLHLCFISRNRNIICVPESCVSRKETSYRYREVARVAAFSLPSTNRKKKALGRNEKALWVFGGSLFQS